MNKDACWTISDGRLREDGSAVRALGLLLDADHPQVGDLDRHGIPRIPLLIAATLLQFICPVTFTKCKGALYIHTLFLRHAQILCLMSAHRLWASLTRRTWFCKAELAAGMLVKSLKFSMAGGICIHCR